MEYPIRLKILGKVISKDNEKIRNKQGRYFKSKRFKDYEDDVRLQVKKQIGRHKPVRDQLFVICNIHFKNKVHADLTNCTKSLFDALNKLVWHDDKQIQMCYLQRNYGDVEKCEFLIDRAGFHKR